MHIVEHADVCSTSARPTTFKLRENKLSESVVPSMIGTTGAYCFGHRSKSCAWGWYCRICWQSMSALALSVVFPINEAGIHHPAAYGRI